MQIAYVIFSRCLSPEYMMNSHVDWRSDIYAIGILGYEMVTGEQPFRGDSVYATMTKRLKSDPALPSTLRKECIPELDRIILKAMARDPAARYQSAAELCKDLRAVTVKQADYGNFVLQKIISYHDKPMIKLLSEDLI